MAQSTILDRPPETKVALPPAVPAEPISLPTPQMEASPDALAFCREILLLEDEEPVSLDLLLEHAVLGKAQDVAFLRRQADKDSASLTLEYLKDTLIRLIQDQAQAAAKLRIAPKAMSVEDAANLILGFCTPEVHNGMQYAQEVLSEPYHRIIAAMLILQADSLAGGDFSQVLEHPMRTNGALPAASMAVTPGRAHAKVAGTVICSITDSEGHEVCGKAFVPSHRGQKYGCQACGETAANVQRNEAGRERHAKNKDYVASVKLESVDLNHCSCGKSA